MKNKIMFMIVALFSIMLLVPNRVSAETVYPKVTNDTKPDTLVKEDGSDIKVEGSETDTITVTVSAGAFKLLDGNVTQDGASGTGATRPDNHAWVGLHFVFAAGVKDVEIGPKGDTFDSKKTTFDSNEFTEYFGFDLDALEEAAENKEDYKKVAIAKWKVGEVEHELTINLIVKPENITLYDKDSNPGTEGSDNEELWNEDKYLETSNQVIITYNLLVGEETKEMTVYWDKDKELTLADVQEVAKSVDEKYVVVGVYATADKKEAFDLGEKLAGNTTVYVQLGIQHESEETTEENPNTLDNVVTYIALGAVGLISSLGLALYLRKENN